MRCYIVVKSTSVWYNTIRIQREEKCDATLKRVVVLRSMQKKCHLLQIRKDCLRKRCHCSSQIQVQEGLAKMDQQMKTKFVVLVNSTWAYVRDSLCVL